MDMPSLIEIENGQKVTPMFSAKEMTRRLSALRAHMAEAEIDAVLFSSYHNICYYADFIYCHFGRFYGLVVTQEDQTSISANIDGGQPWRRSFGDNIVYTDWQRDNYFQAARKLIPAGVQGGARVGIEFDHVSLQNKAKLEAALPGASFVDIGQPAMRLRMM